MTHEELIKMAEEACSPVANKATRRAAFEVQKELFDAVALPDAIKVWEQTHDRIEGATSQTTSAVDDATRQASGL